MRDDATAFVSGEGLLLPFCPEDLEPEFRVVTRGGTRRGIRLERIFWASLKKLAESRDSTLGAVIDEISEAQPESANLASAIRVACISWLADQNAGLQKLASLDTVNAIVLACPSPAFALSSSKNILTFNPPFQQLIRRQLLVGHSDEVKLDLRLALDMHVADIFSRLDANGKSPVVTGFVVGAGDRRYRGQLNAVRAPLAEPELLMAFVFNS